VFVGVTTVNTALQGIGCMVLLLFVGFFYGSFPSHSRAIIFKHKNQRMLSLRTYLRTNRANRLGECVIYFIVGDEWISSTLKVHPDYWDVANGVITKKHPKYYVVNPTFQQLKGRAEQCISNYQTSGQPFSRLHFETTIFEGHEEADNPCFIKLIDQYTSTQNLSWGRIKHYDQLKKDIQAIVLRPRIKDITYQFGLKLQGYLRKKKDQNNNENTIVRKMRMLKALVHFAQKLKILSFDPLVDIKLKEAKTNKKYLTADELEILESLYKENSLPGNLQQTLRYFLFSCYTALRYSDIITLTIDQVKTGSAITTQEKTDKPVSVPVIAQARALISTGGDGYCFKTFTNQATNRFLKLIMETAGIEKRITYHCSRHTFGTLSIYWGIPTDVVAELMGIDLKTVKIYAQIVDQVKIREMLKWERKTG